MSSPKKNSNGNADDKQGVLASGFAKTSVDEALAEMEHPPGRVTGQFGSKTGKMLAIFAAVLGIGLLIARFAVQHSRSKQQQALEDATLVDANAPPPVDIVAIHFSPATRTLTLPGETRAWYESTIYARVSGYVADWTSNIGDHVTRGHVMANIDTPDLDDQLAGANAKLKATQADVAVAEANSAFAKEYFERWRDSPKGVVSEQEREEKKAEYDSSIARLNAANAQVNLDKADVDRLLALTAFKQVTAPFDGIVTGRHIDIGNLVTAGSTSTTTSLYTVAQTDKIRVFADVPQRASVGIQVGTDADISAEEYPGRVFKGKVARTARAIDPVSRTLRVEVDIDNNKTDVVMPGMYVEVSFHLSEPAFLEVQASALMFRSNGPQVAVVDDQGIVHFHNVIIGHDQGDVVEIASGLEPHDKVALNLSSQITDGQRVTATDLDKQTVASTPGPGVVVAAP